MKSHNADTFNSFQKKFPAFSMARGIDVNHSVNMAVGWHRVIERQIDLQQTIPSVTLEHYKNYLNTQIIEQFLDYKNQLIEFKEPNQVIKVDEKKHSTL